MEYDIGDWVLVNGNYKRIIENGKVFYSISLYSKSRLGRIVGMSRRFEGKIQGSSYDYYGGCGPGYLSITNSKLFYQVKFGMLNKPVLVNNNNMKLAEVKEIHDLPMLFTQQNWSEKDKKILSEDSKNWPRDSKGRWVKENEKNKVQSVQETKRSN